jgi:membrane protease YdiL (CAAX protease family)
MEFILRRYMHNRSFNGWISSLIFTCGVFLLAPLCLFAQCSMCNAVASAQSAGAAHALNRAILILLIPPVVMMSAILIWAFRYRNSSAQS